MLRKLRPRSAYDVMAAIAFFIAVAGGSAYAAATIGSGDIKNNAVLSRHIKNGQVKNPDLAANSVGSSKVIDHSLLKRDFRAGQIPQGAPGKPGSSAASFLSGGQNAGGTASQVIYCGPTLPPAVNNCGIGESVVANAYGALSPNAPIVVRDLFVKENPAPGAGAARSFTLHFEGTDTVVTCTIFDPATTCNSGGATDTIPAGKKIVLRVENSATAPAAADFMFGWRATTP